MYCTVSIFLMPPNTVCEILIRSYTLAQFALRSDGNNNIGLFYWSQVYELFSDTETFF